MGGRRGADKGFDFEVSYDEVVISDVEGYIHKFKCSISNAVFQMQPWL